MKIVVLDGNTLNPGDLSWEELEKIGNLTVYERTPDDLILKRARGAEILFTNKTPLRAETINRLSELRYIGVLATGYDVVDLKAARDNNIVVTNVPTYGTRSVAQMTFALLLELCHHVYQHNQRVKQGAWSESSDFCFWDYPLVELKDKTMGIFGFGRIGSQVARIALALGMQIIAYDKNRNNGLNDDRFQWVEAGQLFREADVVSLHCPLFPETEGIINQKTLGLMKESAFLINTARGKLVVDSELAAALREGEIAGAALDVLSQEPPPSDNPLLSVDNCIITPHIAWATKESRQRLMKTAVENLKAFLKNDPVNVIN